MSSLFVYNLPIRFDEAALRLVFDGEVVNSITWGGCPPPIGRFAIVSGPDTVDYVAGKKPYIAEGHTLGFAFSPVDCASMNVVQASDYRPAEDDAPGARGGRGGRGAGRGRGDGRGRGRGDGRGRGGDAGRGRGEGKRERENTAASPVGEERQLGRKQEEIAFGAATASKKVTFEDDEAAAATADANAVGAAAAEEAAAPAPAPAQVKRAPGTGDSCKFCGSNDHLSRRCPNKAGGAPAPAPPVAVAAPAAPAVSAAPEPVEPVVVKKAPEAPRAVARPPPVEAAPPAPKPQRVQGTSKDSCKFCGSDAHLSRQCPNKNKK